MAAWLQHWCQFGHGHSTLSPVFKYLESSSPAGRPSALEKFHVVWVVRGLGLYGYVIFHKFPLRCLQRRAWLRWQQVRPPESPLQVVGLVQVFSSNKLYALKVIFTWRRLPCEVRKLCNAMPPGRMTVTELLRSSRRLVIVVISLEEVNDQADNICLKGQQSHEWTQMVCLIFIQCIGIAKGSQDDG